MDFLPLFLLLEKVNAWIPLKISPIYKTVELNSHQDLAHAFFHKSGTKTPLTYACRRIRIAMQPCSTLLLSDSTQISQGSLFQIDVPVFHFSTAHYCSVIPPWQVKGDVSRCISLFSFFPQQSKFKFTL